tara:strand:- start:981 stop:1163 length:183 start_codon:yes stop_codon:yes gene_type:complete
LVSLFTITREGGIVVELVAIIFVCLLIFFVFVIPLAEMAVNIPVSIDRCKATTLAHLSAV